MHDAQFLFNFAPNELQGHREPRTLENFFQEIKSRKSYFEVEFHINAQAIENDCFFFKNSNSLNHVEARLTD